LMRMDVRLEGLMKIYGGCMCDPWLRVIYLDLLL
jgi:hypothetical protein